MNQEYENEQIENILFDEIKIGLTAKLVRTLTEWEIQTYAGVSNQYGDIQLQDQLGSTSINLQLVSHGVWVASLVSTVISTNLPGPGSIYVDQRFHYNQSIKLGDTVTLIITVTAKEPINKVVTLDCEVRNQKGDIVVIGEIKVIAPLTKIRQTKIQLSPQKRFSPESRVKDFLKLADNLEPVTCAIVHPCDRESIAGLLEAAKQNLITPILIGSSYRINQIAEESSLDIKQFRIIESPHSHAAAEIAASMAQSGEVEALMKGSLHTDELMHAVLQNKNLRTKRRVSHIFRFEVPLYDKPILISDAALNIKPNLLEKRDIVQNAIDLSIILKSEKPNVAILSAVETINPDIPSTIDAAALCKMADRGQITGGILDGPLAFDNAVSLEAKRIKHIISQVAGQADILIVPDLESGNMLSKQLEYLAGAVMSGVVLGCKIPIALTSRADGPLSRIASAALAKLVAHHYRRIKP